ncbi:MAG: moderate conductance mechanosensitive channel [Solirubrobacteraceae bacterium]|nr:moderate conductance mechanosensitive channel [Solirubrobacteraceae bacterium]
MGLLTTCEDPPAVVASVSGAVLHPLSAVTPPSVEDVCGQDPGFFCRAVLERTDDRSLAEFADKAFGTTLTAIVILAVAFVANKLVGRTIRRTLRTLHSGTVQERLGTIRRRTPAALLEPGEVSLRAEQRINALTSVLRSITTAVIFTIAGFIIVGEFGLNLAPLLAGAGIVGIALGFGAQSLVRDFLSGMFILVEDQFGVGDIVDLDQQTSGTVEAVSLRTTRLRAVDGTVWHVPNGDIRRVGNKSQHWSRALLDVEVAYDTDIDQAKAVIKRVADTLWHEREDILEEPEVWGVERLGPNAIVIRLVVKTRPADQYDVSRDLRQRLKEAFDAEGIEIPFPQQVVWNRTVPDPEPAGDEQR